MLCYCFYDNFEKGNNIKGIIVEMQKKKIFGKIAVIALLIFAVWFYRDSMQDILWGIRQITAKQIVICMILATIYFLLDGALILLAAREFNRKCRGKDAVATTFLCEFYRLITLGSGACFAEILYVTKSGTTASQATASGVYKYTLKKSSIFIFGLFGCVYLFARNHTREMISSYSLFIIIATTICLGIIIVLVLISISEKFSNMLVWLLKVLAKKISFVKKNEEEWMNYIKCLSVEGRTLWKNKRKSMSMLGINLLKCLVIYSVVVVILSGNGVLSWFDIIAIMAASYFLAGVIPAPSGVMSLEFVYGLLMGPFLAVGVSVPAILTFRFFTWIYPAVIGGLFKLLYRGWNSTSAPL